jgi:hypothetical protein
MQHIENIDDEITLKELINKIKEFINEILNKWYVVGIVMIPVMAYFLYKHFIFVPKYNAETKFLVEGNTGGGGIGSLLGQFGIRSGSGKFNPFKISEVAKSKFHIRKILFEKYEGDFIANKIIEEYLLRELWSKSKPYYQNFKFKHKNFENFDTTENRAFINLYNFIIGGKKNKNALLSFNYDEDTGIYIYSASTKNEDLSLNVINKGYDHLKYFFEEEIIASQINTTVILRQKADSIQALISKKSFQAAGMQDKSLGLILATPNTRKAILEKEIQGLTLAYAEVMKSYELADINTKDTKPMFMKLDESLSPLEAEQSSLIISMIKAVLLGFVMASLFIIGQKIYFDAIR